MNTLEAGGRERKEEKAMSLRKMAKVLGISPAYLSYMVNGKRPWGAELRERYLELVNTFVNSPSEAGYEITGAQGGIRTHTLVKRSGF